MDGFTSAGVAGILFAEDFSEDPSPAAAVAPVCEPELVFEPPAPGLTQDDVDAACIVAVRAAETAWFDGTAARRAAALEVIAGELAVARQDAAEAAEAVADGIARTMLGMVSAVLPEFCRRHGDAEVRALLRRLLPVVGPAGNVVVRLHAGLVPEVAAELAGFDPELAEAIELRAANLPPGDVRISWPDGGMHRSTEAIRTAVSECLAELGLFNPTVCEGRSPAHVLAH